MDRDRDVQNKTAPKQSTASERQATDGPVASGETSGETSGGASGGNFRGDRPVRALVISGSGFLAYNAASGLVAAGHRVEVLGSWKWSRFNLSRHWDRYSRCALAVWTDTAKGQALVDRIDRICRKRKIGLVVPADVNACKLLFRFSDRITAALLFPMPGHDGFLQMHDKWRFAQVARSCGAAHPETHLIERPEQVDTLDLPYPLVVKPLDGTSSDGVHMVPTAQALGRYVRRCDQNGDLPILAQARFDGEEGDLTILADRGRVVAWTIQQRHGNSAMRFVDDPVILEQGRRLVEAVSYHGVIDFDVRWNRDTGAVTVIEANPRFPGSLRFKTWSGVNFPALGAALAMGKPMNGEFEPVTGLCRDLGIAPGHLVRAMIKGRLIPPGIKGHSVAAWRARWADPLPHLVGWGRRFLPKRRGRALAPLPQ